MDLNVSNQHLSMLESRNRFANNAFSFADWEIVLSCAFALSLFEYELMQKINRLIQYLIKYEESPSPLTYEDGLMAYDDVLGMTKGRWDNGYETQAQT